MSSNDVFIIQNQDKLFLGKQGAWLDGRDPGALYKTPHKDEAVNEMFETTARDYSQRLSLVNCPLNDRGQPLIDPTILPPPLPRQNQNRALAFTEQGGTEQESTAQESAGQESTEQNGATAANENAADETGAETPASAPHTAAYQAH